MKKNKVIYIDRWLLLSPYCIGICTNEDLFKQELKRLDVPFHNWPDFIAEGKDATVHFFEKCDTNDKCCIVCIKKGRKLIHVIGLLVHETVHICKEIYKDIKEENPGEEIEAYMIQIIAQRLIEEYKKGGSV